MNALISELRSNHRLRLGLWAILLILGVYGLLLVDDERQRLNKEYASQMEHLNKLFTVVGQTEWQERATQAESIYQQLSAKLWKAKSKGLAQAGFQTWLEQTALQAKINKPRIQVQPLLNPPGMPDLWQVTAKLEGEVQEEALKNFLFHLEQNPQWVLVERLEIMQGYQGRFSVFVSAFFTLGGSET